MTRPRCTDCPLREGCTWARFHPQQGRHQPPDREPATHSLRRQILEGRQDELEEVELLALLLPGSRSAAGGLELAETLLRQFGEMRGLERASVAELAAVRGISSHRAVQLRAALELGRRAAVQTL